MIFSLFLSLFNIDVENTKIVRKLQTMKRIIQKVLNLKILKNFGENLANFEKNAIHSKLHFEPRVYPRESYVITQVRPSVGPSVRPSVFKYLRDRSKDFSNFLHEVSAP